MLLLAPLAGYSDYPFRKITNMFGSDYGISEMVSINSIHYNNKKYKDLLKTYFNEEQISYQLFGNDKKLFAESVSLIKRHYKVDLIDINFGCPINKIYKQGFGSYLLQHPDKIFEILTEIKNMNSDLHLTAKVRLGIEKNDKLYVKYLDELNKIDLDYVTLHGRYKEDMFSGNIYFKDVFDFKNLSSNKVIGNGNIVDIKSYITYKILQFDDVMIGRGSVGNPWIFLVLKIFDQFYSEFKNDYLAFYNLLKKIKDTNEFFIKLNEFSEIIYDKFKRNYFEKYFNLLKVELETILSNLIKNIGDIPIDNFSLRFYDFLHLNNFNYSLSNLFEDIPLIRDLDILINKIFKKTVFYHFKLNTECYGERGFINFKKQLASYFSGFTKSKYFKNLLLMEKF